jgi:Ca2+-binding EF-hand superfamily protein
MTTLTRYVLAATLLAVSATACAQNGDRATQARQKMQERLKAADANQDGYIDRKEADAGLPRVAKNFDTLDTDKDGRLSTGELQQAAQNARQRFGR